MRPWARGKHGFLLACLLAFATCPHAAPAPPQGGEEALLTIEVNGVRRGEFLVIKKGDNYWLSPADVGRLQVQSGPPAGASHVSLRELGAESIAFDDGELLVRVRFPDALLAPNRVDLTPRGPAVRLSDPATSLILSYRLSNRTLGEDRQTTLLTDTNVRVGPLLLRQENRLDIGAAGKSMARGRTQLIFEQHEASRRWVAGDVVSGAGGYGSAITGAGLLVTKIWNMDPNALRAPRASVQASTALPAEVEVSVDGSPVYRGNVAPGPIDIGNLQSAGGQRNVRVTVTDIAGRRQVIDQPFFFTETALAEGVHDYLYFVGRRSELAADNRWVYREPAAQAVHRYGVTDALTVSAGGEASRDFATVGAGLALRLDRFGLVSLDALGNRDRVTRRARRGWSAQYQFQTPHVAWLAGVRRFDAGFRSFVADSSIFPTTEYRAALVVPWRNLSWGVDWTRATSALETRTMASLRVTSSFSSRSSLSAELRHSSSGGRTINSVGVIWRHYLDGLDWVGGTFDASPGTQAAGFEVGRQLPQSEGFGYRAAVTNINLPAGESRTASLGGTVNLKPFAVDATVIAQSPGGGLSYSELGVSGALVAIDGEVAATRQVGDSFVLAKLGVPQAGVQVSLNNQVQGTTDANGRVILPRVAAYDRQEVSVNDKQLALTYQLDRRALPIAPPLRSGVVVDFNARRLHAIAGRAWLSKASGREAIASRSWTMNGPAGEVTVETDSTGEFYIERAEPGTYVGKLRTESAEVTCRFSVPASDEPVVELANGATCE
ncbi:fimbria/pilus outer membrane usher protein [Ramlibacter algicola]|uniref:Fimbrial biogenesis outer membrane usher protein n=1 Tax=Ramlibacter algicola TaxID=2795217 RepID=A0A934PYW5_9BURK|nr:fimbria/pilus outer membrane usher protein [Ramlibacter algicola]MBK0391653.1 fimbrial biogenesis outer membrane usher protein [Ramlibacter algicola]